MDYIKKETKRISKIERKKILEADARRILIEYRQLIDEIAVISNKEMDIENVSEEIRELYSIQSQKSNEDHSNKQGIELAILGLSDMIHGLMDVYSLPIEILVDQIDKCMQVLFKGMQKIERKICNIFKRS